jgi:hypothetical protein
MTPAPTVSNILASMGSFLTAVLPSDVVVVQGQPNRVAAPSAPRYVVMSPPRYDRLETNVDSYADAKFTGSIAGNTLTISAVDPKLPNGLIGVGSTVLGVGIAANTQVTAILTGTGQIGTYTIGGAPQTVGSETISAGAKTVTMNVKATIQLDFHSADETSGDLANVVSALMRDSFAIDQFANQSPNYGVVPLYADDARQIPFLDDSQMIEWRFVVDALVQANIAVSVSQTFSDSIALDLESVDEEFPS